MTNIKISVHSEIAEAKIEGQLTAGMVGVPVSFTFDNEWEGLNRVAVFKSGRIIKDRLLTSNETTVPHEVLQVPETTLYIGVEGRNDGGTIVIPTTWAEVGLISHGANSTGDSGLDPTPSAIDELIAIIKNGGGATPARLSNITLHASAWTGADGLYSQIVTIDGITEYSKVDLLPSVEQLAIFHNKDVAFVTENEDGVVTVYAIGDKPTLDYTMQVSITEVEV